MDDELTEFLDVMALVGWETIEDEDGAVTAFRWGNGRTISWEMALAHWREHGETPSLLVQIPPN